MKVTKTHVDECKQLLKLMGIPYVEVSTGPGDVLLQCCGLCNVGNAVNGHVAYFWDIFCSGGHNSTLRLFNIFTFGVFGFAVLLVIVMLHVCQQCQVMHMLAYVVCILKTALFSYAWQAYDLTH